MKKILFLFLAMVLCVGVVQGEDCSQLTAFRCNQVILQVPEGGVSFEAAQTWAIFCQTHCDTQAQKKCVGAIVGLGGDKYTISCEPTGSPCDEGTCGQVPEFGNNAYYLTIIGIVAVVAVAFIALKKKK